MPADALRMRGRHNAANALAALALATAIGCPLAPMLHGLREYTGEPHRVEWSAASAASRPSTTARAPTSAPPWPRSKAWVPTRRRAAGGDPRRRRQGAGLRAAGRAGGALARAVALIGRDAASIAEALRRQPACRCSATTTLPEARGLVLRAGASRDARAAVPACASLDMFRNYAHRAEVFVEAVRALAADRGEAL
jgi:UDP-N-acetylmuramoylalanine--D-glutamate ligase